MKDKLRIYIENNFEKEEFIFEKGCSSFSAMGKKATNSCERMPHVFNKDENSNLSSYINKNMNEKKHFKDLLFKMIDDRGLKDSDVYNKVHIDRRLFSKIRIQNDYHPSKDTVILLGFAMKLDEEEMVSLLDSASYSLAKNNYYDLIIRFCFINKIYNLNDVNDLLTTYNCKLFSV